MPSEDQTDLAAAVERLKHKCCLIDARSDCRFTYVTELAADIRTVLAALPQWKPIETAPKDGTEVLLRVTLRAGIPGKYLVGHFQPGGHCIEDHPPIDHGWYFWNGRMFDRASQPTHWMELPQPPQQQQKASEP